MLEMSLSNNPGKMGLVLVSPTMSKLPGSKIPQQAELPAGKISDAFGFLKREQRASLSIEEIKEAAKRGWAGEK